MGPRHGKHLNVLLPCFVTLAIMLALVAYAPKLYRVFCGATGYGGTTQRAYSDPTTTSDKTVTVSFDSNVAPDLPWRFEPEQRSVTVHLGEQKLVFFKAENLGNEPIVAHATYNVEPDTSGIYFNKIQCFCFNEERLDPHQKIDMPVVFYVDPAFAKDPDMAHVDTITLSYTFLRSTNPSQAENLCPASSPMLRPIPPTASSCSASGAPPVMRSTATRPARCFVVWSAARPALLSAIIIRRR